jgi:hypothetical protein
MRERGATATATLRCWCGAPIRAAGDPGRGVLVLRHGADPHPLGLFDDPLIARVLAGDPGVLCAPRVRAWLRGYYPAPEAAGRGGAVPERRGRACIDPACEQRGGAYHAHRRYVAQSGTRAPRAEPSPSCS